MKRPLVSIIILSYNSRPHLPGLFDSLSNQTYQSLEIIVVDNASKDDTISWIEHQTRLKVDSLIKNSTNEWFAKGNNRGIQAATGEYIVFCNDDVTLEPNCIEQLMKPILTDATIGMIGGKLLKLTKTDNHNIVDSAGIIMYRSRRAVNRGENDVDIGQFDRPQDIFGITGALMMVRRTAMRAIQYQSEFFDEHFVAYKEDVDASWRMHRAGFRVYYEPTAVAYHARTIQAGGLHQRQQTSKIIRAYSYRNHWWTLYKNSAWKDLIVDFPWIIGYELVKAIYILFTEWSTIIQLPIIIKALPIIKKKRVTAVSNYSLRSWIV